MKLVFATNNPHKVEEASSILGGNFDISRPADLGYEGDIPETHETIRENSIEKAMFIWDKFHLPCFSDDTGLEIDALNGAPGVYSARYAGEGKDPAANRRKVLLQMEGVPYGDRTARFRCVVTLVREGEAYTFEGTMEGRIALCESAGVQGFGYDSIFIPEGLDCALSDISIEEKNALSHRGKAMDLMKCHLLQNHE